MKSIEQIIPLFKELKRILSQEITTDIKYVLNDINYCIDILEKYSDHDIPKEIKDIHNKFYPPHGGLTDYFLWDDDFDKRVALNEELKDVQDQLKAILKD